MHKKGNMNKKKIENKKKPVKTIKLTHKTIFEAPNPPSNNSKILLIALLFIVITSGILVYTNLESLGKAINKIKEIPAIQTPIIQEATLTDCANIITPGAYKLANEVTYTADASRAYSCFMIRASNVVLDCDNKKVNGGFPSQIPNTGIRIDNLENITIKNCFIEWFNYTVQSSKVNNLLFENTSFNATNDNSQAISISNAVNVTINNSRIFVTKSAQQPYLQTIIYFSEVNNTIIDSSTIGTEEFPGSVSQIFGHNFKFSNNIAYGGVSLQQQTYNTYDSSDAIIKNNTFNTSINAINIYNYKNIHVLDNKFIQTSIPIAAKLTNAEIIRAVNTTLFFENNSLEFNQPTIDLLATIVDVQALQNTSIFRGNTLFARAENSKTITAFSINSDLQSRNIIFEKNNITMIEGNSLDGIRAVSIINSADLILKNNRITLKKTDYAVDAGQYRYGFFIYRSNNTLMLNNTLLAEGKGDHGVEIYSDSLNTTIVQNTLETTGDSAIGVYNSGFNSSILNNAIYARATKSIGINSGENLHRNNSILLRMNTIFVNGSNSYGVSATGDIKVFIEGGIISAIPEQSPSINPYGIYSNNNFTNIKNVNFIINGNIAVRVAGAGSILFENISPSQAPVTFEQSSQKNISFLNQVFINIKDNTNKSINDAHILITDNANQKIFEGSTNIFGEITPIFIELERNSTNTTWKTPYNITVFKEEFNNLTTFFNSPLQKTVEITLIPSQTSQEIVTLTNCAELSSKNTIYVVINDITSSDNTCFRITANNITLDGQGHNIISKEGAFGVLLNAGINNTVIKNLVLRNWYYGIGDNIIAQSNPSSINSTFFNNTIIFENLSNSFTPASIYGFKIVYSKNTKIFDNIVIINTSSDYKSISANGIELTGGNECTLKNNIVNAYANNGNVGSALSLGGISECAVIKNQLIGNFNANNPSIIINNTIFGRITLPHTNFIFDNNEITGDKEYAVTMTEIENAILRNNKISGEYGINANILKNVTFDGLMLKTKDYAFNLHFGENVSFAGNLIIDNERSIPVYISDSKKSSFDKTKILARTTLNYNGQHSTITIVNSNDTSFKNLDIFANGTIAGLELQNAGNVSVTDSSITTNFSPIIVHNAFGNISFINTTFSQIPAIFDKFANGTFIVKRFVQFIIHDNGNPVSAVNANVSHLSTGSFSNSGVSGITKPFLLDGFVQNSSNVTYSEQSFSFDATNYKSNIIIINYTSIGTLIKEIILEKNVIPTPQPEPSPSPNLPNTGGGSGGSNDGGSYNNYNNVVYTSIAKFNATNITNATNTINITNESSHLIESNQIPITVQKPAIVSQPIINSVAIANEQAVCTRSNILTILLVLLSIVFALLHTFYEPSGNKPLFAIIGIILLLVSLMLILFFVRASCAQIPLWSLLAVIIATIAVLGSIVSTNTTKIIQQKKAVITKQTKQIKQTKPPLQKDNQATQIIKQPLQKPLQKNNLTINTPTTNTPTINNPTINTSIIAHSTKSINEQHHSVEIISLAQAIKHNLDAGFDAFVIRNALLSKGWQQEQIDEAFGIALIK